MNKKYYSLGNPFKIKFRRHFCYQCGGLLSITRLSKIVSQKSEEAKYFDFDIGIEGGIMVGTCEFVHDVFYCKRCLKRIEYVTQLNFEDVDILIEKLKRKYIKKGIYLEFKKNYEDKKGNLRCKAEDLEDIKFLCITVCMDTHEVCSCKFPASRKNIWERPYYFEIQRNNLIRLIQESIKVD